MSQPTIDEEMQNAARGTPAAILGVDEFGRRVLDALDRARQTRPGLPQMPGLLAMPAGWQEAWDEATSSAWGDPESWWRAHQEEGQTRLQELILRALYGAAAGGQDSRAPAVQDEGLDIYLVGHFNEPATRALWPSLLQAARGAHIPFADHTFTLIFALDSLAFRELAPAEADDFRQGLDILADELLRAADGNEPPGRVSYAYFVDSLDLHARPLRPLSWQGDGTSAMPSADERLSLQAHMVAEFIVLAVAGLRRTPAYRSVSLSRLAQEMRDEKAQPLVATFAAGSELLPVTALARRGRDALAYRLLAGYLVGRERATDLPAAGKLCRRWLAEQALDLGGLRLRIEHDRQGLPLQLALEPPEVGRIPDEWLVDSLLNWDTLLWKRWQRPDGPAARMAENATRLAERAGAWLDEELDELLQREPGGIRLAGLFVDEAAKALEDEQARTEDDGTVAGGWLKQLLASLQRPPRDPTLVPDLEASRQSLERALARRVNRRAVWTRAVFFSATLLAFLWTAYLAAGQELGLSGVVARLLESERHWRGDVAEMADLGALTALSALLAVLHGWLHILTTENAIHRRTNRLVTAISDKYSALREQTLRRERSRVYAILGARLAAWRELVADRRAAVDGVAAKLQAALQADVDVAPLLFEESLLDQQEWDRLLPAYDESALQNMAEQYLHLPDREVWKTETAPQMLESLRAFAMRRLAAWRRDLTLTAWLGQTERLVELAESLDQRLTPAYPLSREERAAVKMGAAHAPYLPVRFVGLPEGMGEVPDRLRRFHTFHTNEPGRFGCLTTLHALPLRRLRLWKEVEAIAAMSGPDRVGEQEGDGAHNGNVTRLAAAVRAGKNSPPAAGRDGRPDREGTA